MTDGLPEWFREQLDADERIARGADPGPWKSDSLGRHDQAAIKLGAPTSTSLIQFDGSRAAANGAHVAWHDPARVLREIDAKRGVLRQYEAVREQVRNPVSAENRRAARIAQGELEDVLRLLAVPYSDRPGYREEWRP